MWAVIVWIIKFIGIMLLLVLGISLVLLISILFIPVRYTLDLKHEKYWIIKGHFSWFLSIVQYKWAYDQSKDGDRLSRALFILGIKANYSKKKEKTLDEVSQIQIQIPLEQVEPIDSVNSANPVDLENTCREGSVDHQRIKKNLFSKFVKKIKNIKYTIHLFCDNIKKGIAKAGSIKNFIFLESTKLAFGSISHAVFSVVRKLAPRNVRGWIHFGMSDPSDTGQILGAISTVYGLIPNQLTIIPDFEQEILACDMKIIGHLHAVTVVRHGIRMILDKNVQNTYKKIKNGF